MAEEFQHICKSCSSKFHGLYCNECGEKVILPKDRSFRTLLRGIFAALTFSDTKFIKSLWLTVVRPGFLSLEHAEGRRVKYLRPLSLFFLLNLVYFLFPIIQLFNASLRTQMNSIHGEYTVDVIVWKMNTLGIGDIRSFELLYDQKTAGLAKMLVILFAIVVSLPLNLIYRTRNRYFTDHAGLAVELVCFNLFINAIVLSVFLRGSQLGELGLTAILVMTNLYFLLRAGYTFYQDRGIKLIVRSVLMILVLRLSLELYRAILFYVTIWAL
ncbi:MAG: DUF3667 domain-containing protein [Cytophagales bacterium]|nr:DUF3667 domain-containing protein [Cytophagales bacterium]